MQNVRGYYSTPAPSAPAPRQATTVSAQGASVAFGSDGYTGTPALNLDNAGSILPGIASGMRGYDGVKAASYLAKKASRSRSWDKRMSAPSVKYGNLWSGITGAVKSSVLVGGLLSIGLNGWGVVQGKLTLAQAGANVAGDLGASAVGGLTGGAATMLGTGLLMGVLGTGFALNLVALGLGFGGYMLGDTLFRHTGLYQSLRTKTSTSIASITG